MARRIFDQAELKSAKAQRFADAFDGCGEWIDLPRRSRGSESDHRDFGRLGEVGLFDQYLDAGIGDGRRGQAA